MPQDTFGKLKQLRDMGLIRWEIHPAKDVEVRTLISLLQEQGYPRIAKILQKEMREEQELEEMAR